MAIGSLSSLGIGSNLELQSILEQLRGVDEQQRISPLEAKVTKITAQLDEFTVVKNKLLAMKSPALSLSLSSTFLMRTIASSNEDALTATVQDGAAVQSVSVHVTQPATKSSWASDGWATEDDSINVPTSQYSSSSLTASTDTFLAANKTMTITYGTDPADTVTISGGGSGKSLNDVVTEINASALAADITATAKKIDGKYYLLVSSDAGVPEGEVNRVDITSTATGLTFTDEPPAALSQFSTTGVANAADTFLAANSHFVVNYGSGSTYTVSGGITGKSLQNVVTEINNLSGANAVAKQIGNYFYLHISSEEVVANEADKVTITNNTSGIAFQQGDPDDTFAYEMDDDVTLVYVPKDSTLTDLIDLINDDTDNLGVTASVVDTGISGTPFLLSLEADETGEDHRIEIADVNRLDMVFTEKQGSAGSLNAQFTIGGINYERQANTVSDVVTGVTMTMVGTNQDTTITVASDNDNIRELIVEMVTTYNDAVQEIRSQVNYDEETEEFGLLAGTTVGSLRFDLQSLMTTTVKVSTTATVTSLFDLGMEFNQDGTIILDTEVLDAMLAEDSEAVQDFLLGDEDNDITGFGDTVNERLRVLTIGTGQIEAEKTTAQERIDDLNLQIDTQKERLDRRYEILTKQFVELDRYMSQMSSMSSFLTSQFENLSKQLSGGK